MELYLRGVWGCGKEIVVVVLCASCELFVFEVLSRTHRFLMLG